MQGGKKAKNNNNKTSKPQLTYTNILEEIREDTASWKWEQGNISNLQGTKKESFEIKNIIAEMKILVERLENEVYESPLE